MELLTGPRTTLLHFEVPATQATTSPESAFDPMLISNGAANANAVGARAIARANAMLSFMRVRDWFYFNALKGSQ
jgi:hypothetical protein